jgi:hypothetical protein
VKNQSKTARLAVLIMLVMPCGCAGQADQQAGEAPRPQRAEPLILFDGGTLDGWSQAGPGGFQVVDGVMQSQGGMGLLWYAERMFGDFVLDLDWRVTAAADNSGVFVRFPDPGGDPRVAIDNGYEVQINENPGGDPQKTGTIYGFQPPKASASNPVGEWNRYEVQVVGNQYTVWLNDVEINRFTSTDPKRALNGYVGLQNHDRNSAVQFRDIRASPL